MITRIEGEPFDQTFDINSSDPLLDMGFDRTVYVRDLCFGCDFPNKTLLKRLDEIRTKFNPDIVVSVSDNKYLRHVFSSAAIMFMELGPLPRLGTKLSAFVDPFGHQIGSAISRIAAHPWRHEKLPAFLEIWRETWGAGAAAEAEKSGMKAWLEEVKSGHRILLVALQPKDSITYEGIGPNIDPVALTRLLASRVDPHWIVVPQWHSGDAVPSEELIEDLVFHQPNIVVPPAGLRISQSESMLPLIDAVATISSNVAFAAAIIGKPVSVLGSSSSAPLNRSITEPVEPRPDLLAFMVCHYCAPLSDWMNEGLLFAAHIQRLADNPNLLLDDRALDPNRILDFVVHAA
jgi:hypothetical protein